jgi:DNA repair protein RecO (recombination protein O)
MDKGYVLHSYPYRETSLILQVWTEKHGRLGLVAKGARRPKSASRSVLIPFQPLSLDWFGRGELRTLKTAEPASPATPLGGSSLLSAFYLNELLLKLTTRDDPHEGLFAAYDDAITALRSISRLGARPAAHAAAESATQAPRDIEPVLRRFELRLLQELGYAVELSREARTHAPIEGGRDYWYVAERGPIAAPGAAPDGEGSGEVAPANAVRLRGQTLIDLAHGIFDDVVTIVQSKQLMRLLIHHSLNGQELATRVLVRDLQRLDEEHGSAGPERT